MKQSLSQMLDCLLERERLGLPVRLCPCTCGNSSKGLSCKKDCGEKTRERSNLARK